MDGNMEIRRWESHRSCAGRQGQATQLGLGVGVRLVWAMEKKDKIGKGRFDVGHPFRG
jgi:hypothetical protein